MHVTPSRLPRQRSESFGDVRRCDQGLDGDRGDEGGGDGVGAHAGVDRQGTENRGVWAQQRAVEVRGDDVAGQQGEADPGTGQAQRGRALFGAY
jgi:hypothetical protein